jgi:hypothetical protein
MQKIKRCNELLNIIDAEHAALREYFDEVAASVRADVDSLKTPELMKRLAKELEVHFGLEEVHGIFDQIERDAPHLAHDVQQLRNEHAILLMEAGDLVDMCREPINEKWVRQFSYMFRRFRDRVASHESEEHRLLQRAYCVDLGTKD